MRRLLVVGLIILAATAAALLLLVRRRGAALPSALDTGIPTLSPPHSGDSEEEAVRRRYARGEIDYDEYESLLLDL